MSWDHWRVPNTDVLPLTFSAISIDPPPPWLHCASYMDDVKARDQSCRVSGIVDFCQQAHLVPAGERDWWDSNMAGARSPEIESAQNGILLRPDLRRSFDTGTWIPMAVEGSRLVVYVVRDTEVSSQFLELWHATEMQQLVGIDRLCLFARVAWTVLSLHHNFLAIRRLASDNLLVRMKDGELKEVAPEVFEELSRLRSRKRSPTKRPRLQGLEEEGDVIVAAELVWSDEDSEEGDDGACREQMHYDSDNDTTLYRRGRKRFRSLQPEP